MSDQIKNAFETLQQAIHDDPDYAWGWFCNMSVPILDAIRASPTDADKAAAFIMQTIFRYDVTAHPNYTGEKSPAQKYFEMRVEAERQEDAARP